MKFLYFGKSSSQPDSFIQTPSFRQTYKRWEAFIKQRTKVYNGK